MGFISSSRVCNIVMTSVLRKEENCENRLASGKTAPDLQQPSYLCLLLRLPPLPFRLKTATFSVKITSNVSRPAAVSRCLIGGVQGKHLPQ